MFGDVLVPLMYVPHGLRWLLASVYVSRVLFTIDLLLGPG